MNKCERCHFAVQWRMSVKAVGGSMLKVCEDCAEDIQNERDQDNREPREVTFDEALGNVCGEREQQAEIQRTLK